MAKRRCLPRLPDQVDEDGLREGQHDGVVHDAGAVGFKTCRTLNRWHPRRSRVGGYLAATGARSAGRRGHALGTVRRTVSVPRQESQRSGRCGAARRAGRPCSPVFPSAPDGIRRVRWCRCLLPIVTASRRLRCGSSVCASRDGADRGAVVGRVEHDLGGLDRHRTSRRREQAAAVHTGVVATYQGAVEREGAGCGGG
jgi:hypothetical protein